MFNPIYKYNEPYYFDDDKRKIACVFDKYCGAENPDLNVNDPSVILNENIRQKCIHSKYEKSKNYLIETNDYINKYWKYVIEFAEKCADELTPDFTQSCAEKVFNKLQY